MHQIASGGQARLQPHGIALADHIAGLKERPRSDEMWKLGVKKKWNGKGGETNDIGGGKSAKSWVAAKWIRRENRQTCKEMRHGAEKKKQTPPKYNYVSGRCRIYDERSSTAQSQA